MIRRVISAGTLPVLRDTVFVQPHTDDAVLSSFTHLSRAVPCTVVTVFSGVPAEGVRSVPGGTVPAGMTPRDYMLGRRAEDEAVLSSLGADAVHLDFLELQFRDDADESRLVDDITDALLGRLPSSVRTLVCPIGIGGNPNHTQTADAVARVAVARGIDTVWCADYPYAALPAWPAWVESGGAFPPHWGDLLNPVGENLECTVVRLDEATQGAKSTSFAGYASQVKATERGEVRAVTDSGRLGFEVFFARPSVLG
jgi:LmbE family N-acetylglucosaminyl deacetylase